MGGNHDVIAKATCALGLALLVAVGQGGSWKQYFIEATLRIQEVRYSPLKRDK